MADSWNDGVRGDRSFPSSTKTRSRSESRPGIGKTFGLVRRVERILHPDGFAAKGGVDQGVRHGRSGFVDRPERSADDNGRP